MLDLKTIMVSYSTSNVLIAVLMAVLWWENRRRYDGLSLWLIASIMQALGMSLHIPRDILPDIITIIIANTLFIGGNLVWYLGLERFVGKRRTQIHNVLILTIFVCLMSYFTYVRADISMRVILWSVAAFLIAAQCSELMLRRVDPWLKHITRYVGLVFLLYALVAFARLVLFSLISISPDTSLFQLPIEDKLILLVFQMFNFGLMFALVMMVTGRQRLDIQKQDAERRQAEEALRESEERLRSLFENAEDHIFIADQDLKYVAVNPSALKAGGFTLEDVVGKGPSELFPDDAEFDLTNYHKVFETGKPIWFERELRLPDGFHWFSVTLSPIKDTRGCVIGLTGISRDITERKQAEKVLQESEEQFRFLTAASFEAIVIHKAGIVLNANNQFYEMFGCKPEEVLGKEALPLHVTPKDLESVMEKFVADNVEPYECTAIRKDGTRFPIEVRVRGMNYKGQKVRIAAIMDITERKRAEEEKERLEAQLRHAQKMESIGTLAGGIAHEFNNILGIIIGNSELAIDQIPEWNPSREFITEIRKASFRAKDVVRQILSFARKSFVERKPIKIVPIIEDTLKLLRSSIPTTIDIQKKILCERDTVLADPTQINQILVNLCTNAAQAMSVDGGLLEVTLQNVEFRKRNEELRLESGNYVELTVRDTGHGIDPKILDRIFDPYFTTKGLAQGTGMGLAVVQGIVKSYDGAITVKSEVGKGSVFEVLIPCIEAKVLEEIEKEEALPTGDECILFVDDEEGLVRAYTMGLKSLGYDVISFTDPLEALEAFQKNPERFDLVITDMTMPHLRGDKLAKEMMEIRPDIPVILCTGYSERISNDTAEEMGIKAYTMKPLIKKDLAKTVRKVLDEAKG